MNRRLVLLLAACATALVVAFRISLASIQPSESLTHAQAGADSGSLDRELSPLEEQFGRRVPTVDEQADVDVLAAKPDDGMHRHAIRVALRDADGRPYSGVDIEIAAPNHPFVVCATTDTDGLATVQFRAFMRDLDVDVVFSDAGYDLSGVHRVGLSAEQPKEIRVSAPRRARQNRRISITSDLALAQVYSKARGILAASGDDVGAKAIGKIRAPWLARYACEGDGEFSLFSTVERDYSVRFDAESLQGRLEEIQRNEQGDRETRAALKAGPVGTIRGYVTDESGQPLVLCPIWAEFSGPNSVAERLTFSGRTGAFSLGVLPGEVRCYVGHGEQTIVQDFLVEEDKLVEWNPMVSTGAFVHLELPERLHKEAGEYGVQGVTEEGEILTVARRHFNAIGSLAFPVRSSANVRLHLLHFDGRSARPVGFLGSFTGGDSHAVSESACSLEAALATAPSSRSANARNGLQPEALVFLPLERWGYRTAAERVDHGMDGFLIPPGDWDVELSFGALGRRALGVVAVAGSGEVPLPEFAVPEPGLLQLRCVAGGRRLVRITHSREDVPSLAYDAGHSFVAGGDLNIALRPGEYLVEFGEDTNLERQAVCTVTAALTSLIEI